MADDGTLATNFRVYARFTTRAGNAIDCRDPQTDCLIAVSSAFSEDPLAGTTLPVTFDPLGELAEPGAQFPASAASGSRLAQNGSAIRKRARRCTSASPQLNSNMPARLKATRAPKAPR